MSENHGIGMGVDKAAGKLLWRAKPYPLPSFSSWTDYSLCYSWVLRSLRFPKKKPCKQSL